MKQTIEANGSKVDVAANLWRATMSEHCLALFDKESKTFIVRIFGHVSEDEVVQLYQRLDFLVEEKYENQKFNIVLNVDEAAHYSYKILKLAREGIVNMKRKDFVGWVAAVNEDKSTVDFRNINNHEKKLTFFQNEKDALTFLLLKNQEQDRHNILVGDEI